MMGKREATGKQTERRRFICNEKKVKGVAI